MPVTRVWRFVFVLAQVNANHRLIIFFEPVLVIELQVCRCVVNGIATNNHQQLNSTRIDVVDQILQRLPVIDRVHFDRIGIKNCLTNVAQRVVHRVRKRMNDRRLVVACENDARTAMLLQVGHQRPDPGKIRITSSAGDRSCNVLELARFDDKRVVSRGACVRGRCFDDVKPVHLLVGFSNAPARDELAWVTQMTWERRRQKVAIERKNPLGLIELVSDVYRLTERRHRTSAHVVAIHGFILVPLRLRKRGEQFTHLRAEAGRNNCFGKETNARALLRTLFVQYRTHRADERSPRANVFTISQLLWTIGIVKTENRSLRENVSRARSARISIRILRRKIDGAVVWMIRIALDLCRPSFVTSHEDRNRGAEEWSRSREEQSFAGYVIFRLIDVRNDLLRWLKDATR